MEIVSGQGDNARIVPPTADSIAQLRQGRLRVRQRPGPRNSLGTVKFVFPNDANVYLHSTPAPPLFNESRRDFSHGCVRVEDPVALAEWALKSENGWSRDRIIAAMEGPRSLQVNLDTLLRQERIHFGFEVCCRHKSLARRTVAQIAGTDPRVPSLADPPCQLSRNHRTPTECRERTKVQQAQRSSRGGLSGTRHGRRSSTARKYSTSGAENRSPDRQALAVCVNRSAG
jgi:hypothetical protein